MEGTYQVPKPTSEKEAQALIDMQAAHDLAGGIESEVDASKVVMVVLDLAMKEPDRARRLYEGIKGNLQMAEKVRNSEFGTSTFEDWDQKVEDASEDFLTHWRRHERNVLDEGARIADNLNSGIKAGHESREQMKALLANLPQALATGDAQVLGLGGLGGPRVIQMPGPKADEEKKERPN